MVEEEELLHLLHHTYGALNLAKLRAFHLKLSSLPFICNLVISHLHNLRLLYSTITLVSQVLLSSWHGSSKAQIIIMLYFLQKTTATDVQ